jgi:hypothetical protein
VTGDGFVQEAVDELYAADPDEFVARRGALAKQAREAGDAPAAKRISALRKPTRSAWVVNQLVRCEPGSTAQLTKLGEELRLAQEALDGAAIRELSQRRRDLVDGLTRQAFAVTAQQSPPAALRDEVVATLGAALVDPEVARQLAAGTLDRAVQSSGFGSAESPTLTAVPRPAGGRRSDRASARESGASAKAPAGGGSQGKARAGGGSPAKAPVGRPGRGGKASADTAGGGAARPAASVTALAAARERAERERRRQAARDAKQQASKADRAAATATRAEEAAENALQALEEQLADARERLTDARTKARRARSAQRQARRALDRTQQQ